MHNKLFVTISILISVNSVFSETITTFIPVRQQSCHITIDIPGFEPRDMLMPKTILGGHAKDDMNITIVVEKTEVNTKPDKIRDIYGNRAFEHSGLQGSEKRFSVDGISILAFKWKQPEAFKDDETVEKWVENKMSYHGYMVHGEYAFDIHLSADMQKSTEDDILNIIKSFKCEPSNDFADMMQLWESIDKAENSAEKEKSLKLFAKKYPENPIGSLLFAEHVFDLGDYKKATILYRQAFDKHQRQPIIFPHTLWLCYDGLGMCYGITGKYSQSLQFLDKGYELAKKMKAKMQIGASSYNLACLYAATNKPKKALEYLAESIEHNPRKKDEAKTDSSFNNLRGNSEFDKLVN